MLNVSNPLLGLRLERRQRFFNFRFGHRQLLFTVPFHLGDHRLALDLGFSFYSSDNLFYFFLAFLFGDGYLVR